MSNPIRTSEKLLGQGIRCQVVVEAWQSSDNRIHRIIQIFVNEQLDLEGSKRCHFVSTLVSWPKCRNPFLAREIFDYPVRVHLSLMSYPRLYQLNNAAKFSLGRSVRRREARRHRTSRGDKEQEEKLTKFLASYHHQTVTGLVSFSKMALQVSNLVCTLSRLGRRGVLF